MKRRDPGTIDMFAEYRPPEPVAARIDPEFTKGGTLDVKIAARVLAHAMEASGKPREQIAEEMSDYLGYHKNEQHRVSKTMLEQYASPARRDQKITLERFMALLDVTGCYDLLAFVCGQVGFVAVPERYSEIIEMWRNDVEIEERLARREVFRAKSRGLR